MDCYYANNLPTLDRTEVMKKRFYQFIKRVEKNILKILKSNDLELSCVYQACALNSFFKCADYEFTIKSKSEVFLQGYSHNMMIR